MLSTLAGAVRRSPTRILLVLRSVTAVTVGLPTTARVLTDKLLLRPLVEVAVTVTVMTWPTSAD